MKKLVCLGVCSILYYFYCGFKAGFHVSLLWLWLLMGAGLIIWGLARKYGTIHWTNQKWWHRLRNGVSCLMGVIFAYILIFGMFVTYGSRQNGKADLDYVIILGAAVNGTEPSYALLGRIMKGYDYWAKNQDTIIIAAGGKSPEDEISEAECIQNVLVELGVNRSYILIENHSATTVENLRNSYGMIHSSAAVGIVTSDFHVFRACYIAKKFGFSDVSGISSPYSHTLFLHYTVRESIVFLVDLFSGNMR